MNKNIKTYNEFLLEKKLGYEYQIRDICGDNYYKRKIGGKYWEFTTKEDFEKNINDDNVIQWLPSLDINPK
jgi:hypothetical protein